MIPFQLIRENSLECPQGHMYPCGSSYVVGAACLDRGGDSVRPESHEEQTLRFSSELTKVELLASERSAPG